MLQHVIVKMTQDTKVKQSRTQLCHIGISDVPREMVEENKTRAKELAQEVYNRIPDKISDLESNNHLTFADELNCGFDEFWRPLGLK